MNKNIHIRMFIALLVNLSFFNLFAQEKDITAITEDGKEVQLMPNGTFAKLTVREKIIAKTGDQEVLLMPNGKWHYFQKLMIKDVNNLKKLGRALKKYAKLNDGRLPDDLGELLDWYMNTQNENISNLFICPTSQTKVPKNGTEIRKGSCDYIYLGKGKSLEGEEHIPVILTDPSKFYSKYVGVLFGNFDIKGYSPIPENIKKLLKITL